MKKLFLLIVIVLGGLEIIAQVTSGVPIPNKAQIAWSEAELGVVFHYDLHVFDGEKYRQGGNRIKPVPDYNIFNPELLDTDQWIRAAKSAGAKFALLTATHETGFALYQSNVNPYCLKAVNWQEGKGDIVRDFVNSCRKYDIKPGIYIGIRWNSFFGVHNFQVNGEGDFRNNRQEYYKKMCEEMVREICSNYGELFEIWFDGGADHPDRGSPDVLPIVKELQPNALFYHNAQLAEARWGGSESGTVGYPCWSTFPYPSTDQTLYPEINSSNFKLLKHGTPDGSYWMAAMSDAPLRGYNGRHEWFWEPGDEDNIYPVDKLIDMYYKSVGRNSTLIIGLTPDPDGLMPEPDVKRLEEFGAEIKKRFQKPITKTSGESYKLELRIPKDQIINHLVIREEISKGQRIRNYVLEALINGKWKVIADGSSVGNKRIQVFENLSPKKVRLTINESSGTPQIKDFSVYFIHK